MLHHSAARRITLVVLMNPPARSSSLVRQRIQLALGAAAALAAIGLSPGSAQAYVVVGGVQYDVTTFTGSYNENISKFATPAQGGVMPWWTGGQDGSVARLFSLAVGTSLGLPNTAAGPNTCYLGACSWAPFFAFAAPSDVSLYEYREYGYSVEVASEVTSRSRIWAQATSFYPAAPAPGPLPLFGAAAAFGFSRQLRKRIKLAPNALASSLPLA
jgi:hypothetical protein